MAAILKFAFIASSLVAVSNGYCTQYSSYCGNDQVCCSNECVFGSDCLGKACSTNDDCSGLESCCGGYCRNDCKGYSCSLDSDCGSSESCCGGTCSSQFDNCLGKACSTIDDCSGLEGCCGSYCRNDCKGYSCSFDSDCGYYGSCCDGTCSSQFDNCYYDPTAVVLGSIFGTIIFSCMVSMCIYACRRRRIARPNRVIVGQRITATTVTTTRRVPQVNPPYIYPGQMPPSYQQGYPYYPPPKYEQHQAAAPPPYDSGTTRGSEQPPPYSATTQGRSGGVNAPQRSYGAVQTPSSQPVS